MTVIAFVENSGGMLFNGRRVSRDRSIISDMEHYFAGKTVWIAPYSLPLFENSSLAVSLTEKFDSLAPDAVCFLETVSPDLLIQKTDTLVLYRFQRDYPFDMGISCDLPNEGFTLLESITFKGNSHAEILREVYKK